MPITIDGNGTITGAATLATTVANPTFTTPNINSAQFATVSGTAPIYPCRAWVNFNGTGTVAIRASGNVTSITDNGTGDYTVNFTTAMPDVNYSVAGFSNNVSPYNYPLGIGYNRNRALATTSVSIYTGFSGSQASLGGVVDSDFISVQVFR